MFRSTYGVDLSLLFAIRKSRAFSPNVSLCSIGINVHIMPAHVMPIQCDCYCCFSLCVCVRFMYARIASHSMLIFIVLYCCLPLLKLLLLILFCCRSWFVRRCNTRTFTHWVYVFWIHWHFVYGCVPNIISFTPINVCCKCEYVIFLLSFFHSLCRFR